MPDIGDWISGATALKTTFDGLRSAIGLLKDAKGLLPEGEQKEAISLALENAATSAKLAEAEVAKGLGYQLCMCEFPPTPMLTVGYMTANQTQETAFGKPVFECPKCGLNNSAPFTFTRTKKEPAGL